MKIEGKAPFWRASRCYFSYLSQNTVERINKCTFNHAKIVSAGAINCVRVTIFRQSLYLSVRPGRHNTQSSRIPRPCVRTTPCPQTRHPLHPPLHPQALHLSNRPTLSAFSSPNAYCFLSLFFFSPGPFLSKGVLAPPISFYLLLLLYMFLTFSIGFS